MAAGTISSPPERCNTGRVKSIDVAPHRPSAVERLRRTSPGISIMAISSRARSLKKAALPITGPNDSVSKIPEREYQPKPDAIARPVFSGRSRIKALITPATMELEITMTATIIPRRFRTICFSVMPLFRSWIPIRNSRKISVYSLASVACCKNAQPVSPSRKPSTTTPHSFNDSSAIAIREGSFS